ncbi:recombination protein RecR [Candidatus Amesbacteria bacterium]|nr:recombination protein RecR [Candidatus Amesbacteria bacterium]
MRVAKAVSSLIEAFERLPGIGPKTAARLTYYLLHVPQAELDRMADSLSELKRNTKECSVCHNISETDPCDVCGDRDRDKGIDPLHNVGPEEIRIDSLLGRIRNQESGIREVILALNPNMEGEATSLYIKRILKTQDSRLNITRLAHGLPVGGDIEYADDRTLTHAMEGRREY